MSERKRIIRPEPWLLPALRARPKLVLPDFRNAVLDFLTDVSRELRDRDKWVETTANVTMGTIVSTVLNVLLARILPGR